METYRPMNDKVLVSPDALETKSKGGLFLRTENARPRSEGTVLAVGPGRVLPNGRRQEMAVQVGDRVAYNKYGHEAIGDYLFVDISHIYGVVG